MTSINSFFDKVYVINLFKIINLNKHILILVFFKKKNVILSQI